MADLNHTTKKDLVQQLDAAIQKAEARGREIGQ
jgi:hypothetical protein